jgi:hypothetical protein
MNILDVDVVVSDAYIKALDVLRIIKDYENTLPESNFISNMKDDAMDFVLDSMPDFLIEIENFEWCGNSSGYFYDKLVDEISKFIVGNIEVVFHWEGGDISGLQIKDGVAITCDVEYKLVPLRAVEQEN